MSSVGWTKIVAMALRVAQPTSSRTCHPRNVCRAQRCGGVDGVACPPGQYCCLGGCIDVVTPCDECAVQADCPVNWWCCEGSRGNECISELEITAAECDVPGGGFGGVGGTGGAGGAHEGGSSTVITPGSYPTLEQPEGFSALDFITFDIVTQAQAHLFEDDLYLAIAGSTGQRIHRLSDGAEAFDFSTMNDPSYFVLGANNALVSIGPSGYADRRYDEAGDAFGFAQLGLMGQNITGLTPVLAPSSVSAIYLSSNSANRVYRLDPIADPFGGFNSSLFIDEVTFAVEGLATAPVVHMYSPPLPGPMLGIGDGNPGRLWWVDPQMVGGLTVVGNLGNGPRRIDCLEPAGTPCAVSNFSSGEITLIDWPDRAAPPTIGAVSAAVDGPVGIDVAMVDGAPSIVATGFNDDTVHLITIGPGLMPTSQTLTLAGCTAPGHALFLPGATHIVVTCNGSDNFLVLELPLSV